MGNWDDVRHFLALAEAGSLAAAGRTLGVRHTTIARRVAQLEEDLGVALIVRTHEGVQLTEAGERVLEHARAAGRAMDALQCAARGTDDEVSGAVRVAVSEAFSGFLARRLLALKSRYPDLHVHLLVANRAHDLSRGEADIALRFADTTDPDLRIRKIAEFGWGLYAARGYLADRDEPDGIDALREHSLIGYDQTMSGSDGAVWLREHGLDDAVVLRTNSIMSAYNGAISGLGIAPLPCFLGEDESHLVRVLDLVIAHRSLYLVTHPDLARAASVRAVIDYLVELVDRERAVLCGPAA